jgi:hypothetical protein
MESIHSIRLRPQSFPTKSDIASNPVRGHFQPPPLFVPNRVRGFFQPATVKFPTGCEDLSNRMRLILQTISNQIRCAPEAISNRMRWPPSPIFHNGNGLTPSLHSLFPTGCGRDFQPDATPTLLPKLSIRTILNYGHYAAASGQPVTWRATTIHRPKWPGG